jgi:hypothetical protein
MHQRLGPQHRASVSDTSRRRPQPHSLALHVPRQGPNVDADGFHVVESCRRLRRQGRTGPKRQCPVPPELVGRCFNCLAHGHVAAQCHSPSRCLHCRGTGHRARACRRGRSPPRRSSSSGAGHGRRASMLRHLTGPRRPSMSPGRRAGPHREPPPSSPPRVQQSATPLTSPLQHHDFTLLPSSTLGDINSCPKVEVFVISRSAELATVEADLSLVIVTLAGGNRPAITLAEVRAHLSSVYHVSEGVASISSWLDRTNRGPSTPPRRRWFDNTATNCHDPRAADGIELVVPHRPCHVEPGLDPLELEAELAARASVVPSVSRALFPPSFSSFGIDQDSMPTAIVQPQPAIDVWSQAPAHGSETIEPVPMLPVDDVTRVVTLGGMGSTMPAACSAV